MTKTKLHLITVLNGVSSVLPPKQELDNDIIQRIQKNLKEHIDASNNRRPEGYEIDDVSVDINFKFEDISKNDFNAFPLTIEDITIRKFLRNTNFSRNESEALKGVNPANQSLRLIAAFLVLSDTNSLTLDDLVNHKLSNLIAKHFSEFIGCNDDEDLSLDVIEGVYTAEWNSDLAETTSIQLILEKSFDGSHLLAEEKLFSKLKTQTTMSVSKRAYGWCVPTCSDVLVIMLKDPKNQSFSFYTSLHIQLDESFNPNMEKNNTAKAR